MRKKSKQVKLDDSDRELLGKLEDRLYPVLTALVGAFMARITDSGRPTELAGSAAALVMFNMAMRAMCSGIGLRGQDVTEAELESLSDNLMKMLSDGVSDIAFRVDQNSKSEMN